MSTGTVARLAAFPAELRMLPQWVVWRLEQDPQRPGKLTKVLYRSDNASVKAKSTDPATWSTFAAACATCDRDESLAGAGFVLTRESGVVGIDLDHCRDVETGVIESWALKIIAQLDTYTELSPSGSGVHLFAEAHLPPTGRKKGPIEMYDSGRYLTVTGAHLPGTPMTVERRVEQVAAVHADVFAVETIAPPPQLSIVTTAGPDDEEVLTRARRSANFRLLYDHGDHTGYPSHSEADLTCCGVLANAGADARAIDRLFRQSKLFRLKWDERRGVQTYGEMTIAKVLSRRGPATSTTESSQPTRFTLAQLLANPELTRPPTAVLPRLVWMARSAMLASREKLGKSTLLTCGAARLSQGDEFLGERTEPQVVLLVWLEEHPGEVAQRLRRFGAAADRIHVVHVLLGQNLLERLAELRKHVSESGATVVLLDSWTKFAEGIVSEASSSMQTGEVTQRLTAFAHDLGVGLLFTHHAKKDGSGYRDSTAIGAAVDVIIEMTADEKVDLTLRTVTFKGRWGSGEWQYRYEGDDITLLDRGQVSLDLRVLDVISATPGISHSKLRGAIGGRGTVVDDAVRGLLDRHLIVDRGTGRSRAYFASESLEKGSPMGHDRDTIRDTIENDSESLGVSGAKSLWDKGGPDRDLIRDLIDPPAPLATMSPPHRGTSGQGGNGTADSVIARGAS